MVKVKDYEELFRKNGWDNYTCNLYEFIASGKNVNILIKFLEEETRSAEEIRSIDSKKLNKLENIFREKGWWDNYSCKFYEWIAKGKNINILIKYLEESIGMVEANHNSDDTDTMRKNKTCGTSCLKSENFE